eukprot:3703407-Amphidinium_carterae.2
MFSRAASVADAAESRAGASQDSGSGGLLDLDTMHRRALEEINPRLLKQKSKIFTVVEMLRHDDLSSSSKKRKGAASIEQDPAERAPCNVGYAQLRQVERSFLASTFAQMSSMSAEDVLTGNLTLEKYAENAIQTLLQLACGFPPVTRWPKPAKDRMSKAKKLFLFCSILLEPLVLKNIFVQAHAELGHALRGISLLQPRPGVVVIDWSSNGFYKLGPLETPVKNHVLHVPGEQAPLGFELDTSKTNFMIIDNDKEMEAVLKFGAMSQQL